MSSQEGSISANDALALIDTGEWHQRFTLLAEGRVYATALMERLPAADRKGLNWQAVESMYAYLHKEPWPYESRAIRDDFPDTDAVLLRAGPGSIIKLGSAARKVVPKVIGLLLYIAVTSATGGLLVAGGALQLWDIGTTLAAAFEKIEDPEEFKVFETLALLSAEVRIVDEEALTRENFTAAYGKLAPFFEEICARMPGMEPQAVKKALLSMKARNIVGVKDDRWHISF